MEVSIKKNSGIRRPVWALFAAALVIGLVLFVDQPISRLAESWTSRELQKFFSGFSKIGPLLLYAVFGALYGYARLTGHPAVDRYCRAYIKAQLFFSFALVRVLKIGVGRMRPGAGTGFNFFSLESRYNSFPSGHAADVFVGAVILYTLLKPTKWRRWRFVPLLYAGMVAAGRITGGWHYLSDVVAGATIGVCGAFFFLKRAGSHPAAPNGASQR